MGAMCRSVTGMMLVAALIAGCGSSGGDDRLTLAFTGFDSTGITQADQVGPTSADIDVVQDICTSTTGTSSTIEPFENARINANFINNEGADITVQQVTIDFGPNSGLGANGIRQHSLNENIPGGRCVTGQHCVVDADCTVTTAGGIATCVHSPATVPGFVLIDVDDKIHINPDIMGQATNVTITFFAVDDANHSFEVTTHYDIVFANYDNCGQTTAGGS